MKGKTPPAKRPDATFRPFEAQLRELAKKAKEEERVKKVELAKAEQAKALLKSKSSAPTKKVASQTSPTVARHSTLTAEEQRELDAMKQAEAKDDPFFFERLMSGVVPLEGDTRGRVTGTLKKEPKKVPVENVISLAAKADDEVRAHLMNLVEGSTRFEVTDDGKHLSGKRLDLAEPTFRRLKRGEIAIDGRLDLHGLAADAARTALENFLKERRNRRDRMVLVIHGRGSHSPAGIGVLRGEIAAWLSQGRSSADVAAFATAHEQEGGEGALYVLLRS